MRCNFEHIQMQYYHRRWLEDSTGDHFFKWLDRGGGKGLSLDECPRETLESEVSSLL